MDIAHIVPAARGARIGFAPLAALVAAVCLEAQAAPQYVFTTIDYPGSVFTDVRGINNAGQIVGYASLDDVSTFPFMYGNGVFTRIPNAPGDVNVSAEAINDNGLIVGSASDGQVQAQGVIYRPGTYQLYSKPGSCGTTFRGINNAGFVTGFAELCDAGGNVLSRPGFIFDSVAGTWTDILVPGAGLVIAHGINSSNTIAGSGQNRDGGLPNIGFVRDGGTGAMSYFHVEGKPTRARGINDAGVVAGFVDDSPEREYTFVGLPPNNENIAIAGIPYTIGEGINNSGQVSGLFKDAAGKTHGFIATPAYLPLPTEPGNVGFEFSVPVTAFVPVFIDPEVALGYEYEIGKKDPTIARVRLPIGIGDNFYSVAVGNKIFGPIAGGQVLDFLTGGFPQGVRRFRVFDIEMDAALDPTNPYAFPTELTFTESGMFTGSMTALCLKKPLSPEVKKKKLLRALKHCVPE